MVWSVLAGMAMTVGNVAQEVGSPNNGAKSLVLIIDDPDAPDPRALKMVWVHWVVYNLPPDTKSSPENTGKTGLPQGADRVRQARNENERWRIELCGKVYARPALPTAYSRRKKMKAFLIIFWIHQVIFGLSSLGAVLNLLLEGGTTGQLNLVPLLLAWIAGSLTWGFGFVMAERLRSSAKIRVTNGASQA